MNHHNSPINFSPFIIGTMRLGAWGVRMNSQELERFIDECLDLGLNDFDHADIYGHYTSETEFGTVLKRRPDLKSKVQITTKCGINLVCDHRPQYRIKSYDSSKAHILASAEHSLQALGLDSIDLLLLHRPDYLMNPHDIAEAFAILKKAGKVKHFGVSNFSAAQFDMLNSFTPLVNHQIEISLLHKNAFDDGTLDQCLKHRITPTAWSPFGGGRIFSDEANEQHQRIRKVASVIGEKYNASLDQILLAWLHQHPAGIISVLGTSKISRIKTAMAALDIPLTREDWYDLWQASTGVEIP